MTLKLKGLLSPLSNPPKNSYTQTSSVFIFRISRGIYLLGQPYRQFFAYLYKKDDMQNKPPREDPFLIPTLFENYYRNHRLP